MSFPPLWRLVVFVLIVCAFFYDRLLGIRTLGVAVAVDGVIAIRTQRIPYGIRGRPPSGYLTGWAALGVGVAVVVVAMVFLLAPKTVERFFCGRHGCS